MLELILGSYIFQAIVVLVLFLVIQEDKNIIFQSKSDFIKSFIPFIFIINLYKIFVEKYKKLV